MKHYQVFFVMLRILVIIQIALVIFKKQHLSTELKTIIDEMPIDEWKNYLVNDFEQSIFLKHPKIKELKELFYSEGAVYSSMSGSGSCVFGIFDQEPNLKSFEHYQSFLQKPNNPLF